MLPDVAPGGMGVDNAKGWPEIGKKASRRSRRDRQTVAHRHSHRLTGACLLSRAEVLSHQGGSGEREPGDGDEAEPLHLVTDAERGERGGAEGGGIPGEPHVYHREQDTGERERGADAEKRGTARQSGTSSRIRRRRQAMPIPMRNPPPRTMTEVRAAPWTPS